MKTVTKEIERTVKETKTFYIANDGEEFYSETECKNYEESALYALKKRLTDVLVKVEYKDGIDSLVDDWNGCGTYYSLKFKNEQQIKDFISYCNLHLEGVSCNYKTFNNEEEKKAYREKISKTFYVLYEELKPNVQYLFMEREGWGKITSYDKLISSVKESWKEIFEQKK